MDEDQTPVFATDLGPGALSDQDFSAFIATLRDAAGKPVSDQAFEAWLADDAKSKIYSAVGGTSHMIERISRKALAQRYAFNPDPQPPAGAPDCE